MPALFYLQKEKIMTKKDDYTKEELAEIIVDLKEIAEGLMPGIKHIAFNDFAMLNDTFIAANRVERAFSGNKAGGQDEQQEMAT
jgi:hypothetical protein